MRLECDHVFSHHGMKGVPDETTIKLVMISLDYTLFICFLWSKLEYLALKIKPA